MVFGLTSAAILLYWLWWGLGATLLLTPRRFPSLALAMALPLGLALQSAAAWWILQAGVTIKYCAAWIELVPAIALVLACLHRPSRRLLTQIAATRTFILTFVLTALCLFRAVFPFSSAGLHTDALTTVTIGSCDAPDYALGIRIFQEYRLGTGRGFADQHEVHQISPHITLWTFWTKINHFAPTVAGSFFCRLSGLYPWQILSSLAFAFGAALLPTFYVAARHLLRLPTLWAFAASLLIILSPLWMYGAYHVALGQLAGTLASFGVMTALWYFLRLGPGTRWRASLRFTGLAFALQWLLISAYWISWPFALGLGLTCGVLHALLTRQSATLRHLLAVSALGWALSLLLFFPRTSAALQALTFFGNSFGWSIAPVDLPAVLGWPASGTLEARPAWENVAGWSLTGVLTVLCGLLTWRRHRVAFCLLVPTAILYGAATLFFFLSSATQQPALSYKLYKLVSVLGPALILVGVCALHFLPTRGRAQQFALLGFLALMVFTVPDRLRPFKSDLVGALRQVDAALLSLVPVSKQGDVQSVNIVGNDLWARLWVSAIFVHKRQYFEVPTYVGRGTSPLRGEWTFGDATVPHDPAHVKTLGGGFWFGKTASGEPKPVHKEDSRKSQ